MIAHQQRGDRYFLRIEDLQYKINELSHQHKVMRAWMIVGWSAAAVFGVLWLGTSMTRCACGQATFEERHKPPLPKGTNVIRVIPIAKDSPHMPVPEPMVAPAPVPVPEPVSAWDHTRVTHTVPIPVSRPEPAQVSESAPRQRRAKRERKTSGDLCQRHGKKKVYTDKYRWRCR